MCRYEAPHLTGILGGISFAFPSADVNNSRGTIAILWSRITFKLELHNLLCVCLLLTYLGCRAYEDMLHREKNHVISW